MRVNRARSSCLRFLLTFFMITLLSSILLGCDFTKLVQPDHTDRNPDESWQPSTEPSPEPTKPVWVSPVPEEYRNNVYVDSMGTGSCETMTGDIMLYVIFLNDTVSSWDMEGMDAVLESFENDLIRLEEEASAYGAATNFGLKHTEATIDFPFDWNDPVQSWVFAALDDLELGDTYFHPEQLEDLFEVDHVPVVFVINQTGRAYAHCSGRGNAQEYCVIFSSELASFRHELCHLFGAEDFYFPMETEAVATKFLPDSIMLECFTGSVDTMTAYLIGWTEQLDAYADMFLLDTNHLTKEYVEAEREKDQMTGVGTRVFPDGDIYTGDLYSGSIHGKGTLTSTDGSVYTGDWVHGNRTGYGVYTKRNGTRYEGEFLNNAYHGQGTLHLKNGDVYTGTFVEGKMHGQGTYTFQNGDVYTGEFVEGKRVGYGVYTNTAGFRYEGSWANEKYHGNGTAYYTNGSVYTGEWSEGKWNGTGEFTQTDGFHYTGEFEDNFISGNGTAVYGSGASYEGQWEYDKPHGQGTYRYVGGDVYVGEFEKGKQSGRGEYKFKNGASYKGEWKNGKYHGTGTMKYSDGSTYVGEWKEGMPSGQGKRTWNDGSYYIGQWLNGKQNGKGEYYYASYNTRYVGGFLNGKREGWGTYYYADGTIYEGPWSNDARVN